MSCYTLGPQKVMRLVLATHTCRMLGGLFLKNTSNVTYWIKILQKSDLWKGAWDIHN